MNELLPLVGDEKLVTCNQHFSLSTRVLSRIASEYITWVKHFTVQVRVKRNN
jgi:hypothetical protein